jgi:hypothetical protein
MDELGTSLKDIWRILWHNKPLLIALLAIIAVGIYLLYKNGMLTAPQPTDTTASGDSGVATVLGLPGPIGATGATGPTGAPGLPGLPGTPGGFPLPPRPIFGPKPPIAKGPPQMKTYLVVVGDTLNGVARKMGETAKDVWNDNRATISRASAQHGGPYWDKGKSGLPPHDVKLYAGTVLHY